MREQHKKTGVMPQSLASKPVLSFLLEDYLEAYLSLDRRRQIGYAAGQPLSATDIIGFGLTHGFRRDLRFFFKVISALDDDYIKEQAEKLKKKGKAPKSKSGKRR
jgi:hypothetical protein